MAPSIHRTDPLIDGPAGGNRGGTEQHRHRPSDTDHHRAHLVIGTAVAIALLAMGAALVAVFGSEQPGTASPIGAAVAAAVETTTDDTTTTDDSVAEVQADAQIADAQPAGDLVELEFLEGEECIIEPRSMRIGSSGSSVSCLQQALTEAEYYSGPIDGEYQQSTAAAVERLQIDRNLFVDGVAGRETGISLGIWPDEQMMVIRTPIPPPGATDDLGYRLSSVAVAGADTPPLPPGSGSGRRVVYERISQRVWAVNGDGDVVRSWLVAGSQYPNEVAGTHQVYSRSEMSTAWNGAAYLPKMIRWLKTDRGAIGFHGIPFGVNDGKPYMTEAELGQRLSGGCQRQADLDAAFLWDFAPVGTTVVVL